MAVSLRNGSHGSYYGNDYNSSNALTNEQMTHNAKYIYKALSAKGWTKNSVSALLGNMQVESSINPGRWQSDRVGGSTEGHGYSLVQWTPYTKYTEWCSSEGYSDPSEMDTALARINYEVDNNIQWYGVGDFYGVTFKEFTTSMMRPDTLASAFMLCYERPADQSESAQAYRGELAMKWWDILSGETPSEPDEPDEPDNPTTKWKRRKFNFILFNNSRRRNLWTKAHF